MSEPLDIDALKHDGILAHLDAVLDTLQGRTPIARSKLRSNCCLGPVDVYHGKIEGDASDWSVPLVRVCVSCGGTCTEVAVDDHPTNPKGTDS